jgi:prepilin-type N-terminal cleavage/methylation domain-containing protein
MPTSRRGAAAFTLIELLIAVAIIGILSTLAIGGYTRFIQRAREATVIQYLREIHKGQLAWQLETDAPGFTGDFDELEETGLIPRADNSVRVRTRLARRTGRETETSSRVYQTYRLSLSAVSIASTHTYTYSVTARPVDGRRSVRWFYLDQTGTIRVGPGRAGAGSPPLLAGRDRAGAPRRDATSRRAS